MPGWLVRINDIADEFCQRRHFGKRRSMIRHSVSQCKSGLPRNSRNQRSRPWPRAGGTLQQCGTFLTVPVSRSQARQTDVGHSCPPFLSTIPVRRSCDAAISRQNLRHEKTEQDAGYLPQDGRSAAQTLQIKVDRVCRGSTNGAERLPFPRPSPRSRPGIRSSSWYKRPNETSPIRYGDPPRPVAP